MIKMIKVLSFWYSKIVLRFLMDNEKIIYRNLERNTLKLERNKSHLMFHQTCYNNNRDAKELSQHSAIMHNRTFNNITDYIKYLHIRKCIYWFFFEKVHIDVLQITLIWVISPLSIQAKCSNALGLTQKNIFWLQVTGIMYLKSST